MNPHRTVAALTWALDPASVVRIRVNGALHRARSPFLFLQGNEKRQEALQALYERQGVTYDPKAPFESLRHLATRLLDEEDPRGIPSSESDEEESRKPKEGKKKNKP